MKNNKPVSVDTAITKTVRTNALVHRLQIEAVPFHLSFWELLHLARELERELVELQEFCQASGVRMPRRPKKRFEC